MTFGLLCRSALEADAAMRYINPRLTLTLTLTFIVPFHWFIMCLSFVPQSYIIIFHTPIGLGFVEIISLPRKGVLRGKGKGAYT